MTLSILLIGKAQEFEIYAETKQRFIKDSILAHVLRVVSKLLDDLTYRDTQYTLGATIETIYYRAPPAPSPRAALCILAYYAHRRSTCFLNFSHFF